MLTLEQKIAKAEAEAKAAIERANAKLGKLKARKEAVERRKLDRLIRGNRAEDNRRKILVGAMVLKSMDGNESIRSQWIAKLDAYLTRDDDRALFGLPPKPETK